MSNVRINEQGNNWCNMSNVINWYMWAMFVNILLAML